MGNPRRTVFFMGTDSNIFFPYKDSKLDSIMNGNTTGTSFQPVQLDTPTHTLQTIEYPHHEIHVGRHFMYTDAIQLGEASQIYMITTPDTTRWAHMIFELDGSAITEFALYEGADRTGTTLQTIGNNNRNSDIESGLVIHKGVSAGTTDGNLIHVHKGGSATNQTRVGSNTGNNEEIILKQNTKYILKVTSGTNPNLINIKLEWYEHIDRTA